MRLLVFGQTGQVARELARRLPPDMTATFLGRDKADLLDPAACAAAIAAHAADAVINAAAWTAVDKAESEEAAATVVNGDAPGAMARVCAAKGISFLHVSTDYVFDGKGTAPFAPTDPVAPQNAYGRSKLVGENAVRDSGARHVILRTSWVEFDCTINDIPSSAYPTPATRPLNSQMDCSTLTRDFGIPRPDWRAGLTEILQELTQ